MSSIVKICHVSSMHLIMGIDALLSVFIGTALQQTFLYLFPWTHVGESLFFLNVAHKAAVLVAFRRFC
jgi:hypothetical protein